MSKAKKNQAKEERIRQFINGRRITAHDRPIYEIYGRSHRCLFDKIANFIKVHKLDSKEIMTRLAHCQNIEQQIVVLRQLTRLTPSDLDRRRILIEKFLNCLRLHHGVIYQGLIFGSSINGLGFRDSDIDLRLRPLHLVSDKTFEPFEYPRQKVEDILKNIAYRTTNCTPVLGSFVPSRRCPIAKLTFLSGQRHNIRSLEEQINCDISLLSTNALGSFNSIYIRFLCHLEPKFHLLATTLRQWSKAQDLILPGYLSSYAFVNMLIFFCQNISPPLLPTVNQMREVYLQEEDKTKGSKRNLKRAMTRQEWNCLVCFKKKCYSPSKNKEPLSLLLLKFFEFYLNYSYSSRNVMVLRTGKCQEYGDFEASSNYDSDFPMNLFLSIQDPFDLKHNLTAGIDEPFFRRFIVKIRLAYERLFREMLENFTRPLEVTVASDDLPEDAITNGSKKRIAKPDRHFYWGLNAIFGDMKR